MILKLLLSILFFITLPIFKISYIKFCSKIIFAALFIGFSFNNVQAQCNSGATAGIVSSNTDKICVGSTENFWSAGGWGGGTWSSSNSSIVEVTTSGGNASIKGIAPGTVDIIYTLTQSGCSDVKTSKKTIIVYGALGATENISGVSVQCNGNTSQVYSVPAVTNAVTYTWTVPSGWAIVSGQNTNSITTTIGMGSGNITLAVANACKTNNLEYYYVGINSNTTAKPTISTSGSTSLCAGGSITLTSTTQNNYLWSTGETTRAITVNTAGTYTVKTTEAGYCPSDLSDPVNVTVTAAPTFIVSPSSAVCANTNVTYTTQSGKTNYTWSIPGTAGNDYAIISGGIGTGSNTVTLQWKTGGSKTVTVNYNTGCAGLSTASNTTTITTVSAGTASSSPQVCMNTGNFNDRLVLRYTNKTLGIGDFENTENDLIVSVKEKVIKVNSAKESIRQISIFDITGKILYTKNKIEATDFQISNLQSGNQVLFIKVTLENGFIVSEKIILDWIYSQPI